MKRIVSVLMFVALSSFALNTFAQKYGNTPEDSVNCLINNSLYQEFYQQKNYKDAYKPWKAAIKDCPQYHINLYIRGAVILKQLIVASSDAAEQSKYIDELISLYDNRAAAFGDEANNIARKAKDISDFLPNEKERVYNLYKEAVEKGGKDLDDQYKPLYLKATFEYLHSINASEEQMSLLFDSYDYAADALEHSLRLAKTAGDEKTQQKIESYIAMIEQVIEPFATCDKIEPIFRPKYDKNPQDIDLLKKITTTLERKSCVSSELFFLATESLHRLEPSAKSAVMMGKMLYGKEKFKESADYFKEAIEQLDDDFSKAENYYLMGLSLMQANQYSAARAAFNEASKLDPQREGKCLVAIAQMYLSSAASCASHDGKIRGAAWVAYDKAARAKSLDIEVADQADRIMSAARSQWPTQEGAFFYSITNGQSFSVGCWINESTVVRLR